MSEPVPFSQFVVKVHSRCDLACDICYVYEHADQSWRGRSPVMSTETARQTASRIAEHTVEHGLANVHVILHGGEPLLAGVERLGDIIGEFRSALAGVCAVHLAVHTNGTMLTRKFCDMFRAQGVKVGVSLDGDEAANDRHRLYRSGRSSYDQVLRGITLLREEYPDLFSGLLCTIDLANDPLTVYEALLSHRPPSLNFLLQHATWDTPPRRETRTDYAQWLTPIFDRWFADDRPVHIGIFESIIHTARDGASTVEALGLDPNDVVVIETDGEIEQTDSLKTAYDGAPATGLDVFTHSLTEAAAHPEVLSRQRGLEGLSATCQACPVVQSCGGGLLAHRFSSTRDGERGLEPGFANPSVYCGDLIDLITHVTARAAPVAPLTEFDEIAAGLGGKKAACELVESERTIQRVLVARLTLTDQAVREVLDQADLVSRKSIARVASHPVFRACAVDRLQGQGDPGRLRAFAAAVAVHAGIPADLVIPVRDGEIYLPTIGSYLVGSADKELTVRIRDGRCELAAPLRRPRRLTADDGFSVVLEDSDPDRGLLGWPVTGRLSQAEVADWQKTFSQAWNLISDQHTDALRVMLSSVIPLSGGRPVETSPHLFGAIALVLSPDPAVLAERIVNGFQAMKLAVIQDLVELHDRSDPGFDDRLRSAYVALAETGACPDTAELRASSCLTPLGRRFVDGMRVRPGSGR